jgi:hypothetical protein
VLGLTREVHRYEGRASEPTVTKMPAMAVMASEVLVPIAMAHLNDGVGCRRGDCRRWHEVGGRGLIGRGKNAPDEGNGDGELLDQGGLRVQLALSSPVTKNEQLAWRL